MPLFQIGFLNFLIYEIFETMELNSLAMSLTKFWIHTIKDDVKRNEMIQRTKELIENKLK